MPVMREHDWRQGRCIVECLQRGEVVFSVAARSDVVRSWQRGGLISALWLVCAGVHGPHGIPCALPGLHCLAL